MGNGVTEQISEEAARRKEALALERTICLVAALIVISTLIPLYFTRGFFFGDRIYPHTPLFPFMQPLPAWLDVGLYGAMIFLLVLALILRDPRLPLYLFLGVSLGFSLWDQSRWMPYYVQFWLTLGIISTYSWDHPDPRAANRVLNALRVIPISIWIWSGLHKASARYLFVGYPWLVSPFVEGLDPAVRSWVHSAAFLSPFVEAGGGLLLLFRPTRKLGCLLLTAMHIVILILFGPLGHAWNQSVWSWNVTMIGLVYLLFWKTDTTWRDILFGEAFRAEERRPLKPNEQPWRGDRKSPLHLFTTLFFGLLPAVNLVGYWDDFMSHALYSWTTVEAEVHVDPAAEAKLPEEARRHVTEVKGRRFVHVLHWSYSCFESPPYHADRVYFRILNTLCRTTGNDPGLELWIFRKPSAVTGRSPVDRYRCHSENGEPVRIVSPNLRARP